VLNKKSACIDFGLGDVNNSFMAANTGTMVRNRARTTHCQFGHGSLRKTIKAALTLLIANMNAPS